MLVQIWLGLLHRMNITTNQCNSLNVVKNMLFPEDTIIFQHYLYPNLSAKRAKLIRTQIIYYTDVTHTESEFQFHREFTAIFNLNVVSWGYK